MPERVLVDWDAVAMTTEHRLRFDLTALAAVVFECATCRCNVAVPLAAINPPDPAIGAPTIPAACAHCGTAWEQQRERSPEARFIADLSLFLQGIADPYRTPPAVNIRLYFDAAAREGDPEAEIEETDPDTLSPENMPGLDLAYGFVQPSYQWLLSRFEAGNTRLQARGRRIVRGENHSHSIRALVSKPRSRRALRVSSNDRSVCSLLVFASKLTRTRNADDATKRERTFV